MSEKTESQEVPVEMQEPEQEILDGFKEMVNLPEAGGVVWCEMRTAHGVRVNLTARGVNLIDAIDALVAGVMYSTRKYGWTAEGIQKPPQASPAPAPAPTTGAPAPAPAPSTATVPPPPVSPASTVKEGDVGEPVRVKRMEIVVRPEGKIELRLFAEGHKYADLVVVRTLENAVALLQQASPNWVSAHLQKAGVYDVDYVAEWVYGKQNSSGGHYKNITSLRAVS